MTAWRDLHWRAITGLASFAAAILLLVLEGVRTTRFDLLAIAATCLVLAGFAWIFRRQMNRSVP